MASTIINAEQFSEVMGKVLHEEMIKAAEPFIQSALKDIEVELRRKIAVMVLGQIQTDYDVVNNGMVVHIRVNLSGKEGPYP